MNQSIFAEQAALLRRDPQVLAESPQQGDLVPVAIGFGVRTELNKNKIRMKGLKETHDSQKSAMVAVNSADQDQPGVILERVCGRSGFANTGGAICG